MFSIRRIILPLALIASVPLGAFASELLELEGGIRKVTVGGVETQAQKGFAIGNQIFIVDGPMAPAVEASVGQHLAIKGLVYRMAGIGCEAAPKLIVGEMALARFDAAATTFHVSGCLKAASGKVQIGGKSFTPAGPLAAAVLALNGCEVEITGEKNPVRMPETADSIVVTSIGKRDITKAAAASGVRTLDTVRIDALGRYSKVHPGTPEGTTDGTVPRVKTSGYNTVTGRFQVVVETFGGIAGISLGHEMLFIYDAQGQFLTSQAL
ncbi:MAG: hypothetical protein HY303_15630 [Candidatus Wallbacteria bacterium]|nr:hypothetical protein [Candidatus Wallbacteria bacterium]